MKGVARFASRYRLTMLAAVVIAVLVALVALSGRDSGEDDLITIPPPPTPEPTASAPATVTPVPTPTVPPPMVREHVVWIVEAETGEYVEVYRGSDGRVSHWQRVAPDGTGFWVSRFSQGDSVRFGWDGEQQDVLEAAFGAVESADGRSRVYALGAVMSGALVVEHEGGRLEIEDGVIVSATFSPDGEQLSYFRIDRDTYLQRLLVISLVTGEERELAREIGPCECDGGPRASWSPSGRYLVYSDFGAYPPDEAGERPGAGTFLVEVATGEERELASRPWARAGWLEGEDDVLLLRHDDRLELFSAGRGAVIGEMPWGESRLLEIDGADVLLSGSGEEIEAHGRVIDSGWLRGNLVLTPDGLVRSTRHESQRAPCPGVEIEHPALEEKYCIEGAVVGAWSRDGRFFATSRWVRLDWPEAGFEIIVFDAQTGTERVIGRAPGELAQFAWNEAGTHVLVLTHPDL